MLFLPFLGRTLGVFANFDFFPITKVRGDSTCPVLVTSAAALDLGVFGKA